MSKKLWLFGILLSLIALMAGTFWGEVYLSYGHPDWFQLVSELRWPTLVAAFAVGSILAVSGLAYQLLFNNPLASPYTLGTSLWASLGAIITLYFVSADAISLGALVGALFGLFLALKLSNKNVHRLTLAGVGLSFLASGLILLIQNFLPSIELQQIFRWMIGSLSFNSWPRPLFLVVLSLVLLFGFRRHFFELQALAMGDDWAKTQGISASRVRLYYLLLSTFAVAMVVSMTGPIGFIGLAIPHIAFALIKRDAVGRLYFCALYGGLALLLCQVIAKVLSFNHLIPVGIITAILGTPFYLYQIRNSDS